LNEVAFEMKQALRVVAAASLMICAAPSALAEDIVCPVTTKIESATLVEVPDGWTEGLSNHRLRVRAAGFYSGPPSGMAELKPDFSREKAGVVRERWTFEGYPENKGIWVSCVYEGYVVSLAKKIPQNITECTVRYKKTKGVTAFEGISCKTE